MGSPISPIVANIYMEAFETRAISTALHPPRIWKRYVDDTFVLQQQACKEEFLQHINTVDPSIQFTVEVGKEDGSIPFLDTIIRPEADGSFTIGVYRNPTHTDLYLPWDSNHSIAAKYCYVRQCSLFAYLILSSLYEMCLGVLHYISLYALSLHSTLCSSSGSFSLCVRQNKRTSTLN